MKFKVRRLKRIISAALIIAFSIMGAISLKGNVPVFNPVSSHEMQNEVSISFSVLGDIHGDSGKFQEALRDIYNIRENTDALILNGDTVDEGMIGEYDDIKVAIKRNNLILPKIIIKNIGNHEFFDYKLEYNTDDDVKMFIGRYLKFADEKTVYHDKWIKGYHFISLGSENGNTKDFNSIKAYISPKQLDWLKVKLAEDYKEGKPIYVFLHQNLINNKGWVGSDQSQEIIDILSKYPEVILFSSHTHASLESDSIKLDLPFVAVHTGAVKYTLLRKPDGQRERVDGNYGLYVEVQGNKTIIRARDFKRKAWLFIKEIVPGKQASQ